jgi:hypothetical protein
MASSRGSSPMPSSLSPSEQQGRRQQESRALGIKFSATSVIDWLFLSQINSLYAGKIGEVVGAEEQQAMRTESPKKLQIKQEILFSVHRSTMMRIG